MGQYFIAVNEDRREFIHPHRFGDGLKFFELCSGSQGFLAGLAHLLRKTDDPVHPLDVVGSWAGCKIILIGDYDSSKIYEKAFDEYKDVSFNVMRAMVRDKDIKASLAEATKWRRIKNVGYLAADKDEQEFYEEVFGGGETKN